MTDPGYVIITPARNEADYIGATLHSVVAQTALPREWLIVSDGSTDGTDEVVKEYLQRHRFIRLLSLHERRERTFASKAYAFAFGYRNLRDTSYGYIGNLDADVSIELDYFERILGKFAADPELGIGGGFIYEKSGRGFSIRPFNTAASVAGAAQFFRRECYEAIGGYLPLKYGAEDSCAEVMARMAGWRVESFPEIKVYHNRRTGSAGGRVYGTRFRQGLRDFSIGNHPVFELFKCLRRMREKPRLSGSLLMMAGFVWGHCRRERRLVSQDFVRFLRLEQLRRMRAHRNL